MIYGDIFVIGIQLELVAIYDTVKYGMINFVIDERLLPGQGTLVDLYPTLEGLKSSLQLGLSKQPPELASGALAAIDFVEPPPGIIRLQVGMLEDFGFCCCLGFTTKDDRFFYSTDYAETFQEQRYPRGTIERLINSLPKIEEVEFCSQEIVRNYPGPLKVTRFEQTGGKGYR
ncbi:immunity 42 family protein [unidentified bacterial endosymbiont]|uniref:immunity 42 family protein n=1 Tax=unidentified bacterial endosymbiont TaxID=2355 RepID=UPI00209F43C7|nr:immunity 42 family protein [unidentified bacterial endosymbiont]